MQRGLQAGRFAYFARSGQAYGHVIVYLASAGGGVGGVWGLVTTNRTQ
jgi:hypothetical protein